MTARIKIKLLYIPEGEPDKYASEQLWYEQICAKGWLTQNNPDFFQKVIASFNGVEWVKNERISKT
jgi:hypothetical protein